MAASMTTGFPLPLRLIHPRSSLLASIAAAESAPRQGDALEILGHAIEYLADEYVHEGRSFSANDGQLQAIQLLMAVNRQVYFECPEVPPLARRVLSLFHLQTN